MSAPALHYALRAKSLVVLCGSTLCFVAARVRCPRPLERRHARLRWPLLRLRQHRREGPPPKHGLQGARGQPGQPFSHKTGHGYVKAHRGFYHDAIFVKRNNFNLLLHETFGGGFSPTAVLKLRRLARKVARGSVDRTPRPTRPSTRSLLCPTMQSASLSLLCEA